MGFEKLGCLAFAHLPGLLSATILAVQSQRLPAILMVADKNSLREGLGIAPQARVAFIVWESQCEQAWRLNLPKILGHYDFLIVYPYGPRSVRHFMAFGGGNTDRILVVDSWEMRHAADEVVMFRVIGDLVTDSPPVRVIDTANRWLSKELSQ